MPLYYPRVLNIGKRFVIKTGVRLENTNMKDRQIIPDISFNIYRTDLFPYIYLSKNLMKIAGYDLRAYLVYRRTINEPVYEQLNRFPRYIDPIFLKQVIRPAPAIQKQNCDQYKCG
ncbi:MAG: outer membrane beta-barrel protein [Chitinophagaceae bacterium]|nr:outer membrane beta-barrel protein [Chitinophagaceae bacterium]